MRDAVTNQTGLRNDQKTCIVTKRSRGLFVSVEGPREQINVSNQIRDFKHESDSSSFLLIVTFTHTHTLPLALESVREEREGGKERFDGISTPVVSG